MSFQSDRHDTKSHGGVYQRHTPVQVTDLKAMICVAWIYIYLVAVLGVQCWGYMMCDSDVCLVLSWVCSIL